MTLLIHLVALLLTGCLAAILVVVILEIPLRQEEDQVLGNTHHLALGTLILDIGDSKRCHSLNPALLGYRISCD